ncbi:hypothetical protein CSOJ01_15645 [Colletotrichum sojae]|uniref:Uncharacterized protein n=1 Tax=Colletotrichum sojae TaxID=2175907 RepID=A0A8H6MHQ5_9PEZI|nr:hypothetical protein CSOJ01_15645 [Colletotrichum sojae]
MVFSTPVEITNSIQEWFGSRAVDGFNVMPPSFPEYPRESIQLASQACQDIDQHYYPGQFSWLRLDPRPPATSDQHFFSRLYVLGEEFPVAGLHVDIS